MNVDKSFKPYHYPASHFLSRALAIEAKPHGIHVHNICPGGVDTDFIKVTCLGERLQGQPMIAPDDIAEMAVFLLRQPENLDLLENLDLPEIIAPRGGTRPTGKAMTADVRYPKMKCPRPIPARNQRTDSQDFWLGRRAPAATGASTAGRSDTPGLDLKVVNNYLRQRLSSGVRQGGSPVRQFQAKQTEARVEKNAW